ncbi:hypothetical protein [Halalkalicoccus tibetensis]|uniref:Uncharacterized protein n=1 Tax=Halalkalicoccus tibetensis TaxID=175632 RepID=A0ABD5V7L2_9EURY
MKPELEDILLPCGWVAETTHEDRIAFRRDEDRIRLIAEPADESPALPELCASQLWRLACERRVGEAKSDMGLGYVSTTNAAVDTLLRHMQQINEVGESDEGISLNRLLELLEADSAIESHDEWGRTAPDDPGPQPLP